MLFLLSFSEIIRKNVVGKGQKLFSSIFYSTRLCTVWQVRPDFFILISYSKSIHSFIKPATYDLNNSHTTDLNINEPD